MPPIRVGRQIKEGSSERREGGRPGRERERGTECVKKQLAEERG